jgi:hypothetical protein
MSIIYKCEQGSMEWYRLRLGRPTASQAHKIVTPTGKISEQRHGYRNRLIAERLLMESMDTPLSVEWVEHGKEQQPNALANFQFMYEVELEPVGFITTNDGRVGCSPDSLIKGRNQAVEAKCPAPFTQIGYLLDGPGLDHHAQVQCQLLVGEFEVVHFYAYHPRMPAVHILAHPRREYQRVLADGLRQFCEELDEATERARKLGAYLAHPGFTTPHEETAPGAEPLTVIVP